MLKIYGLEASGQWDKTVRSFQEYDVYWLSGYVKAFKIHGDGEPLLFYYEDGNTRGINVVMARDVADDAYFKKLINRNEYIDFTTPYGYGGWLIEGQNTQALFKSYDAWIGEHGIISEFVRFHPMLLNHKKAGKFYEVVRLGEVVHMELTSPEDIWGNITGKNRNVIRKAVKNNVKVYNGRYPEIFESFRDIYNATMDKDQAGEYYYFDSSFYESVLEDMPENAQIFYAVKDHKIIAASIMIGANGHLNYHLSGSLKEYGTFAPGNLLLYKAALWGCENGYKALYLGGGVGAGEDSLFKFKRAFYKGDLNHFYIGKRIYDEDKYKELAAMRGELKTSYFPLYRADCRLHGGFT